MITWKTLKSFCLSILKILMSVRCPVSLVQCPLSQISEIFFQNDLKDLTLSVPPSNIMCLSPPPLEYYMSVPPLKWLFGPARSFYTSPCLCVGLSVCLSVGLSVGLSMGKLFKPLTWHEADFWNAACFFTLLEEILPGINYKYFEVVFHIPILRSSS